MRSKFMPPNGPRSIARFSILALAALAMATGTLWAQAAPPLKIGVIDMQAALLSTKDGQKAVAELKAKFAPKEQEFEERQQQLQTKQEQFRKTENTISEEAKATLARDIDAMTKNLQRDTDDARQDVEPEQQRVLNELGQKMMQVIQKYAGEKGLTMVIDVSGQPNNIMYASSTIEITRDIIGMYDAAPPVTTVTPKAPAATTPPPAKAPASRSPAATTPAPK